MYLQEVKIHTEEHIWEELVCLLEDEPIRLVSQLGLVNITHFVHAS